MQVIGKTSDGYMLEASKTEVCEILRSVNGTEPKEICLGQKIPAIDYAGSVTKIKELYGDFRYTYLVERVAGFVEYFDSLKDAVSDAANIES